MARILAIDFGTKRTGIAVTDTMQIIATALDTVPTHTAIEYLKRYMEEEDIEEIVIGEPFQMNGEKSQSWNHAKSFGKKIQKSFPTIPLFWEDERLTSRMAKASLIESGVPKQKRKNKGLLDSASAVLILQSYLAKK